ncbi:bola-like protein [Dichomitus squalens]|uniref:Bola-like protein n=1 Tax=Dichomitus squalens TaxID=114155 RepID=A0A4Q9N060_9APHY|nr:bola-like protein [Dichomitus squalens]
MLAPRRLAIALLRNRPTPRVPMMATMSTAAADPRDRSPAGPIEQAIRVKLSEILHPERLDITNDSWQHRHHAPMRTAGGGNGETHFTVHVVSEQFHGKSTMQRHRMIYAALADEFATGLHALSLKTKTPSELQSAEQA